MKLTTEEDIDNIDFVDLCEQLEALERRVMVQSMHIQHMRLETNGGDFAVKEQLEGVGYIPVRGMATKTLSEMMVEQHISQEGTVEETTTEWTLSTTQGEMTVKLLDEEAEQQLSNQIAEEKSATR